MEAATKEYTVVPNPTGVGAEVEGIDLSQPLARGLENSLKEVVDLHSVVAFREQRLSPEDQIRFARYFGEVEHHVLHKRYGLKGYPELLLIGNVKNDEGQHIGIHDGATKWHSDLSYKSEPTSYSFLYALEVPHSPRGEPLGDTLFVSTADAYDRLPSDKKRLLGDLRAVHRFGDQYEERLAAARRKGIVDRSDLDSEQLATLPDVVHPVITTHPVTKRKCIYVNEFFTSHIEGIARDESDRILRDLYEHLSWPPAVHRHKWKAGDLLVWDNRATQHQATFNYSPSDRRLLRRVIVKGTAPC